MASAVLDHWVRTLEADLFGRTLPFWLKHSVDSVHGGFYNCLDESGEVWDTTKHVWLQGRQCWMFAKIANRYSEAALAELARSNAVHLPPMKRPQLRKAAVQPVPFTRAELIRHAKAGVDFLLAHAVQSNGHVLFALSQEGRAVLHQRKPFSATFLIMALAEVGRATGEYAYTERAIALLREVIGWMRTPGALGKPACEGALPWSPLNIPMILLNIILELIEALPSDGPHAVDEAGRRAFFAEERAWAVSELLSHWQEVPDHLHMQHDDGARQGRRRRVILECVAPGGKVEDASYDGRILNPGHAIEAGWFLLDYARWTGDAKLKSTACDIVDASFAAGWDGPIDAAGTLGHPAAAAAADAASRPGGRAIGHSSGWGSGGMIYFADIQGFSPSPLETHMKLWWPQAESMIAFAMAYHAAVEDALSAHAPGSAALSAALEGAAAHWLASFVRVAEWTYSHLVDGTHGEWYGYADRAGEVTHRFKGGPYKGCFHVPRALLFCLERLQAAKALLVKAGAAS